MIDYEYDNPALFGLAAGQVGQSLNDRAQAQLAFDQQLKLDQLGLEASRLAEGQRQFDISKQLEQNMAALTADRARQAQGLQFSRDRATAAAAQYNDWRDFQQQMALNQANRSGMMDQIAFQGQLQSMLNADNAQMQWNMGAGEQANLSAKQMLSDFQKMNLSPEGQALRSQWRAKINSFQAKQGELRPQTYAQGMSQLMDGMGKAGIEDFEIVDQTPEESLAQNTLPLNENNVWSRKADGSWTVNKLQPPQKPEKAEQPDPAKEIIQTPYGREMTQKDFESKYRTDYADAERRVVARKKMENERLLLDDNKDNDKQSVDPESISAEPWEIDEEIHRFNEAATAFREGRRLEKPGEQPKKKSKPAQSRPPLADIKVMDPQFAIMNGVTGWIKNQSGVFYVASSPEEVANLAPGTMVVMPDGRIAPKR